MLNLVLKGVVVILIVIITAPVKAQFKSVQTKDLNLLYYDFGHEYLVNHTLRSYTNALRFHERMFGYQPKEPITIIMEDFGDYGNAGASSIPRNVVLMGIAPFKHAFETNTANERINVLANHELVHIVALDMTSKNDRLYRKFFGGKIDPAQSDPISMIYGYMTAPRRYSPRWYHEGIAEFMTTWMSGGIGRVMGTYDEMRFRTMVRDGDHIYDAIGLESEGTTVDFEVGANSYMYGTRFMSYLAQQHGPDKLIKWVARTDDSKRYYASQFKNVYGSSLDDEWSKWIQFENGWQQANLARVRENPVTIGRPLTNRPLGGISRAVFDTERNRIYAAIAYPGKVAYIAEINPVTGDTRHIVDLEGPALHFVSSLTYDASSRTIFYTNDNNKWRDLMSVNLDTGKQERLIKDARVGDLVFNNQDKSIWAVRHLNGIASIVRIPAPYTEWNLIHAMPYGDDVYDIDVSPDGSQLTAAISNVAGNQRLVMMQTDSLLQRKYRPTVLGQFEENSPASFVFSPDGKYLYGSTYYTGVSNIVRYNLDDSKMEWLSNAETGLFKPIPVWSDSLVAFEYTAQGFVPVVIPNTPYTNVSAIEFLGNTIAETHPAVTRWGAPAPSPRNVNMDSLITKREAYVPSKQMSFTGGYPIIRGYKDYLAPGIRLDFADPVRFQKMNITVGYSPTKSLDAPEQFHASFNLERIMWSYFANYNASDFYDLFGPTKTSRKGHSLGVRYKRTLVYEVPRVSDFNVMAAYYGGLERLPEFQNITTSYARFLSTSASFNYANTLHSLGAVDSEKGIRWTLGMMNNTVLEDMGDQRIFFPRFYQNLDLGMPLPLKHSSLWLRTSTGISFSPKREPLGNFYLGGFGNNWVDHQSVRRYRTMSSFPGVDLNAIGGTNYVKVLGEWVLPPVRFKRLGIMSLYSNWSQLSLFTSGLVTNIGSPVFRYSSELLPPTGGSVTRTRELHRFYNVGAQVDFKLVMFSVLDATLSFGYANAFDYDNFQSRSDEFMVSLKLLR